MPRPELTLPAFLSDPYGSLAGARAVGWVADLGPGPGVLTYDAVRALLGDPRLQANFPDFLRAFGITAGPFYEWMARSPLNRDGAEHLRWRAVVSRAFTPRRVDGIRPFLRAAAAELADAFASRGRCEFMAEFADVFPSLGLCELIGVPHADRVRFRGWANTIGLGFNPVTLAPRIAEVDAALVALLGYARDLAARRRAEPRDDLVTHMTQAGAAARWSEDEVVGALAGLVFAGHETTKNQLGWMVAVLAEHPAVWNAVGTGALAVEPVVEEVLRLRSAVTGVGRRVTAPIQRDGDRLEAGDQVLLSVWGANHDPRAFPEPERFAPAAHTEPHCAFGHGAHYCLGAALARAELQEALAVLAGRITPPVVGTDAAWAPPVGINGPTRLPLTFHARA